MHRLRYALVLLCAMIAACSLPPQRPFTRQDIFKTNAYTYFTIKESPDSVLAAINREGEAVVVGTEKKGKREYFIKFVAKGKDLKTTILEK